MALILRRPWDSQPQDGAPLDPSSDLLRGLFVSIEGGRQFVKGIESLATSTVATLPGLVPTPVGLGYNVAGTTNDVRTLVDGPLAAADPWTFAVTLQPFGNVSLSHVFGFGIEYSGFSPGVGTGFDGTYRSLLNFNNNYYFWGSSADWDTGIAFDTDGLAHTAMFVHDGTNIYFYRDGVLRAQTARPSLIATPSGRYAVLGNKHPFGSTSPNARLINGRAWSRSFTASEASDYPRRQWELYARRIIIPVSAAGGGGLPTLSASTYVTGSITTTGWRPQITAS